MEPMILLGLAIAAILISAVACVRAYVPPQTRKVLELQGRVEDLEFAHEEVRQRITKRARSENMEGAREAFKTRRAAQDAVLADAAAVLEAAKQPQAELPLAPGARKAELRRIAGLN